MPSLTFSGLLRISVLLSALVASLPALAHEIKPSIFEVTLFADGHFDVRAQANAEAMLADIGPGYDDTNDSPQADLYDSYRAMSPDELSAAFTQGAADVMAGFALSFDGKVVTPELVSIQPESIEDIRLTRTSNVTLRGIIPPGAETFTWSYPRAYGPIGLKMKREGDLGYRTLYLTSGTGTDTLPLEGLVPIRSSFEVVWDYVGIGFIHIVPKGLDHILFVLGLFLLSTRMRPLLVQVTTFTVAHSITLALSLYGVVELSPSIVEPLIALSIAYVAIENIFMRSLSPWRPFVVFGFGLLHGLGFAGVLTDLGLPQGEFVEALIGFNLGVEVGQLAVILVAFLAVGLWGMSEQVYRRSIVIPASLVIAVVGLYWTVDRFGLLPA